MKAVVECREGQCRRKATTIIESKAKGRIFKYYLCNKHWRKLLKVWLHDKGFDNV